MPEEFNIEPPPPTIISRKRGRPKGSRDSAPRKIRRTSPNSSPSRTSSPDPKTGRTPGRPRGTALDPHKDLIVKLFTADHKSLVEIARHLNLIYGFDVSNGNISRQLKAWDVPRKKSLSTATKELFDRLRYHYNKNLDDEQIVEALRVDGYTVNARKVQRLRKKLGLRRRSRFSQYREVSGDEEGGEEGRDGGDGEAGDDDDEDDHDTENDELRARSLVLPTPQPEKVAKKKGSTSNQNAALIPKVTAFVEKYMSKYDGSHDFKHIRRVVGLAHLIYTEINRERTESPFPDEPPSQLDLHVITLAALLHDVGDKKYLLPGQTGDTLVLANLLSFGASEALALKVQRIVLGVSYSSEVKDPAKVKALIDKYPELAVVQDADRLDAIGAVGIGRTFTFGGAKGAREMGKTIQHFEDKLVTLEGMMKTRPGKKLARERTERLKVFRGWWEEEQKEAEGPLKRKT